MLLQNIMSLELFIEKSIVILRFNKTSKKMHNLKLFNIHTKRVFIAVLYFLKHIDTLIWSVIHIKDFMQ